jgi:serine/arginine repetitive matrix protein 1
MADAGYFRGTSAEQDNRFSDKEKKLMKQMRFHDSLSKKVEMSKVHLESLKPWISHRISELLGMEDDVLQEFVFNQLEADKFPDGRRIQINLTGFLNGKNARIFTGELWEMLIAAQESGNGVPPALATAKKEEVRIKAEEHERLSETLRKTMSRFQDKLRESPPHVKPGRSPSPSRTSRQDSRSNETADRYQSDSRGKDQAQSRRQYRSRKSASPSPPPKDRSRSRERDNRGRRDNFTRSDRNTERRERSRRSRSRSPRHRRRSPSPRQTQPRREREYGLIIPDRSERKSKMDESDRTKWPRQSTRSPSPISRPGKDLSDVEPEVFPTSESQVQVMEPDNSPAAGSSDSGSLRGRKRGSVSSREGTPDPDSSKKNKKKSKKHKKHKKHKKSKKDVEDEEEKTSAPPLDDLERALREKALESMKRAYENSVHSN